MFSIDLPILLHLLFGADAMENRKAYSLACSLWIKIGFVFHTAYWMFYVS